MLALNYSLYDCFAQMPFQGHTAAVIDLDQKLDHGLAVKIARELCQTVTCFVWNDSGHTWVKTIAKDGSDWPINHGLLGVARNCLGAQGNGVLDTAHGSFEVKTKGNTVTILLPKLKLDIAEMPERLTQAFDVMPVSVREVGKTCVVELRRVEEIINLETDFNRISKLDYDRVVLTAEDDTVPFDYVCRYFSPKHNINENNGSLYIQTFLAVFWQERLQKNNLSFLQLSPRRAIGKISISENLIEVEAPVCKTFEGVLKVP